MHRRLPVFLIALLSACATAPNPTRALASAPADPGRRTVAPLRVMSFNLRYDNPGDGPNAWPNRKAWVAQLIRFHDADAVGVQKALDGMLVDLDSLLPEYSRIGVGRTDGRRAGEFSAILYKRDRLEALEHYDPLSSTVSGFRGIGREGDIIDYVLVSPAVEVQRHGILPDSWGGRFPSDHLPVLASLAVRCR